MKLYACYDKKKEKLCTILCVIKDVGNDIIPQTHRYQ